MPLSSVVPVICKPLYKKADEVKLSQPTPSFSRGVKPACRAPQEKCSHPPRRVFCSDVAAALPLRAVLHSPPPHVVHATGCPKMTLPSVFLLLRLIVPPGAVPSSRRITESICKAINAGYLHEGTRCHHALLTDAVVAELFFGDFCCWHEPGGSWG